MFSNMPITLSRFSPGLNVNDAQTQVSQGYVDNTSLSAGSAARPAAGRHAEPARPRRSAATTTRSTAPTTTAATGASPRSPNADMIQEMRVESANFDASVGHGLGLQISMMTRAGTNRQRGTVNYQYWSNKLNALTEQQKTDLRRSREERVREGALAQPVADLRRSRAHSGTRRWPRQAVLLRELLAVQRRHPRQDPGLAHHPGQRAAPAGRFLRPARCCPIPAQYQIYDPLTTRPDPANPSRMIRDPFPNNIIPRDRIFNPDGSYKNPLMDLYSQHGAEAEPELHRKRPAAGRTTSIGAASPTRRRASSTASGSTSTPRDGSLLLPHQRHHVPGVRERLDLPGRTGVCASIRRTARAISGRTPAPGRA